MAGPSENLIPPTSPGAGMPYGHLEDMLRENLELSKQNNRMLKRMQRNAVLGFILRVVFWLLLFGVPLYFFSSYLTPLVDALAPSGTASSTVPSGLFGLPSVDQLKQIIKTYGPKPVQQ